MRIIATFLLLLSLSPITLAGEWMDAIAKVTASSVHGGHQCGTCFVVKLLDAAPDSGQYGYAVTAMHVVADGRMRLLGGPISIEYRSGVKVQNCRVVASDAERDAALLLVWVPDGVEPIPVGEVVEREPVQFAGYPYGGEMTEVDGVVLRMIAGKVYVDCNIKPGHSGSPLVQDGCWVGIVSFGIVDDYQDGERVRYFIAGGSAADFAGKLLSEVGNAGSS